MRSSYKLVQIIPGTFIYKDEETEGRYICPVCYEDAGKTISLVRLPAVNDDSDPLFHESERYYCPKPKSRCGFIVSLSRE